MTIARMNIIASKLLKILSALLYVALLILFTDFTAGYALDMYRNMQKGSSDFSSIKKDLMAELTLVQSDTSINLYRWYSNKPNFRGNYIVTDPSGFRIDAENLSDETKIGMFGGSTTISIITDQNGTIPNLLSNILTDYQVLNFGVGGYSTGSEIMTFVEALRAYPDMGAAIFFDGVNELARAKERVGEDDLLETYKLIGAPYFEGEYNALKKQKGLGFSVIDSNLYYIYKRIISKIQLSSKSVSSDEMLVDIANRYFSNLKVINAICKEYEIQCFFVWQPSIFTLDERALSENEKIIKRDTPMKDYKDLTKIVLADDRVSEFNLIDLSNSLDRKSSNIQLYYDWCHLSKEGNKFIAIALAKKLNNI